MRFLWVDTETTGIDPAESGIFEFAAIAVIDGEVICERDYYCNPLSETIKYSEEAGRIHGVPEEKIRTFMPEKDMAETLDILFRALMKRPSKNGSTGEKLIFVGYNSEFDWNHTKSTMERYGYKMDDYFSQRACVFEQVKKGGQMKVVPYLENRKLGTLCKAFDIDLSNAHNALADITATRELATKLQMRGVSLL